MKTNMLIILALLLFANMQNALAQRTELSFNNNWQFTGGSVTGETLSNTVEIPHTWNATDAQEGISYYRGEGTYEKSFIPGEDWNNKRVFIRFGGVMTIAKVYLNNELLGEHKGGYSAFIFELTGKLKFGIENKIKVIANNQYTLEVLPLFGDFNVYGGIYRPVNLLVTPLLCISPLDFASPGVYLKQTVISETEANVQVEVKISSQLGENENITVQTTVFDAGGNALQVHAEDFTVKTGESTYSKQLTISNPKLWNGKADAYLYQVKVDLLKNGEITDSKTEPLGLRTVKVDPNEGFFLNGKHMPLHGVSRHQDWQDKGNALTYGHHREDMDLMLEMGINALRLAHYQHDEPVYDMADSAGLVVWAELPWVGGPGSLAGGSNGYEPTEAFHNNAKQQLFELIRQNFNHPSICFWSIFNEIQNPEDQSPVSFINELNQLAKTEDPSRITVGASMLDPKEEIHDITDAIAWNRYFGWYYAQPKDMGDFLDETHKSWPGLCIGISEYGAGASIQQHSEDLKKPNPFGSPHPEEWQNYYHEQHLKIFNARKYVWGTFLWNMFDFGSYFRREGDHYGINDKGLVSFDRKVKKDAFYFFKANWSNEPVLYITSKKFIFREKDEIVVKVYSNLPTVNLTVNGKDMGQQTPVDGICEWKNVTLTKGNNSIGVTGELNGKTLTDHCVWVRDGFGTKQVAIIFDLLGYVPHFIIVALVLLVLLWLKGWRKKDQTARWKRISARVFFIFVAVILVLVLALKIAISAMMG